MIRIVIVDDMEMIRSGFALILDNEDDMAVVGQAADGAAAIDVCRHRNVDVVLMDIRMPVMDGIEATEFILTLPDAPRVLVLTTFGLDDYVTAAIGVGASGFLLKDASADTLVSAVRSVAEGDAVLSPAVTRVIVDQARLGDGVSRRRTDVAGIEDLTDREMEVLQELAKGLSNAEIAEALFLSEATVKTHLGRVLAKLGVRDRVQAVIAAFEAGIVDA